MTRATPVEAIVRKVLADDMVKPAKEHLMKKGLTEQWWHGLVLRVALEASRHESLILETKHEARERRDKLAERAEKLSSDLISDPDAGEFFPRYGGADGRDPVLRIGRFDDKALSIGEWLHEYAEQLKDHSWFEKRFEPVESRHGNSKKSFVIRAAYKSVDFYLRQARASGLPSAKSPRNVDVAALAASVLQEKVSANDVSQVRRDERRPNTRD